jgi:hypothetical protein
MKFNNLIGVSGSINSGKDLVGEMIQYIAQSESPSYKEFNSIFQFELKDNLYQIRKCADKLKEVVAIIIGCTREQLEDEEFKNTELGEEWWVYQRTYSADSFNIKTEVVSMAEYDKGKIGNLYLGLQWTLVKLTPRMILQLQGTQGGRMVIHPNMWVNALFTDFNPVMTWDDSKWNKPISKWIITDVRFPENEGKAVKDRGGLLIGIKRHFALKQPQYASLVDDKDPYHVPFMVSKVDSKLYASLNHESETSMGDLSWCDVVIENNGTKEDLFNNVLEAVTQKQLA